MKMEPNQSPPKPSCPECDKTFSDNYSVKRHMQVHMKATTGMSPKRCPECDKTFSDNYGVKRHMQVHGKNTDVPPVNTSIPVACKVCDKVFNSTKNMSRHLKTHKDETGKNEGRINIGENSVMGENQDLVSETPLVISLSDNDDVNGVTLGHDKIESENRLSNYTSTAVSLCKSCSQCGKELRDKWALRRHMAMHLYSDGVRVQEASGKESPPKENLDELFDPRSIDDEIEFLQEEAKKYRQTGEEDVKRQYDQSKAKQSTQNWQLPTQNTCEVFLQPENHFLSGLPSMPGFHPPWNMGQKVQTFQDQNDQQEKLASIYRAQAPAFFATPTQNIFDPTQKQTQNLHILPYPGYNFQYLPVPAIKSRHVPIAILPPIAMPTANGMTPPIAKSPPATHPSNLQPRVEKQESHEFDQMQEQKDSQTGAKLFGRNSSVCHVCDKKFQSNYNVKRHLKTHSNEDISCPKCGNRFKTTEYLTKHSKNCTISKFPQNTQYAKNSVHDGVPKSMTAPQFDLEVLSENTSNVLSVAENSPSPPSLSVALQHDILEKFAHVDKIVYELQQLAY